MQKLGLNEKGDVVLYTDNGRMENGEITADIHGDFTVDAVTAASLYSKGKGLSVKVYESDRYGRERPNSYTLTDNDRIKEYEEEIRRLEELYSKLETIKDKIQEQNEIYKKHLSARTLSKLRIDK